MSPVSSLALVLVSVCLAGSVSDCRVLVVGGTGRIGTVVATHLMRASRSTCGTASATTTASTPTSITTNSARRSSSSSSSGGSGGSSSSSSSSSCRSSGNVFGFELEVILGGRSPQKGRAAVEEVQNNLRQLSDSDESPEALDALASNVKFLQLDWRDKQSLREALEGVTAVVHTAGPYLNEHPAVLEAAIKAKVPVYVDVSDPLDYLDLAKSMDSDARDSGTVALCSAGAFPGLSNVLGIECADRLGEPVQDVTFSYFTAGLGGSGEINLLITNEGFGEPMNVYRKGKMTQLNSAGLNPRKVNFYLSEENPSARLVGQRTVWDWPFPEAATVAKHLKISGDSNTGMGTAPDVWNTILNGLVAIVPRPLWRSRAFSNGLAKFSQPLVYFTDRFVGETHAMRIDVTSKKGRKVTAVQAHQSFRQVVGQSCAEFTLALIKGSKGEAPEGQPVSGVYTPETMFEAPTARKHILDRLLRLPGTLNYGFEEGQSK